MMERSDYLNLQSRYAYLSDYMERYRKELVLFINDAFETHGGVFELKPEGCSTWLERSRNPDFDAMDELSYYLLIGVEDDNSHEIHISCIRQVTNDLGLLYIEVDGWDWSENEFVERWDVNYDTESLSTIASFINAVLEQENHLIQMEERIDWEDLEEDLRISMTNEKLWAMGSHTPEDEAMHIQNMENLKYELDLIKVRDFTGLLDCLGKDYLNEFLK